MTWNYRIVREKIENEMPSPNTPEYYWRYSIREVYYRNDTGGIGAISMTPQELTSESYDNWYGETVTEDEALDSIVFMAKKMLEAVDKPIITLPLTYPCDRDGNPIA